MKEQRVFVLKIKLNMTWKQVTKIADIGVKKFDGHYMSTKLSIKSISKLLDTMECLIPIQEAFDDGVKCFFVKNKKESEAARKIMKKKSLHAFVDEIHGDYLVSW